MFGMSFTEIVLILAIALVVLGPDRLPGIAKALGKALREFRRATREIQTSFEVEEVRRTIRERQEKPDAEKGPVLDPKTGEPIAEGDDDLADKKAKLGRGGDVQGPSLVRKPRRPTVAATGATVTAGGAGAEKESMAGGEPEVSIEPPGVSEAAGADAPVGGDTRDEGNGETGASGDSLSAKRDST